MFYLIYFILNAIGQFLSLILFSLVFLRRRKEFLIFFALHLVSSLICYQLDFQPWIIISIIILWVISGYWMFRLRWNKDLKRWVKVALVIVTFIHGATWSDAWYERLINSGWYGYYVQHFIINEDYNIRGSKGNYRPHLFVDLVNKKHPITQKITRLPIGGHYPIEDVQWIPLEGDSVVIKVTASSYPYKRSHTIYLPDY